MLSFSTVGIKPLQKLRGGQTIAGCRVRMLWVPREEEQKLRRTTTTTTTKKKKKKHSSVSWCRQPGCQDFAWRVSVPALPPPRPGGAGRRHHWRGVAGRLRPTRDLGDYRGQRSSNSSRQRCLSACPYSLISRTCRVVQSLEEEGRLRLFLRLFFFPYILFLSFSLLIPFLTARTLPLLSFPPPLSLLRLLFLPSAPPPPSPINNFSPHPEKPFPVCLNALLIPRG